jgi:catechol 2,3-dioxygenase-like lactoylglutathione lyase family enzyme
MATSRITHLRHVAVAVPDFEKQVAFYEGEWGLTRVAGERDLAFFAAEGSPEQYVLRIRRADAKRIDLIAFGAADAADVDALAEELAAGGVRFASEPGRLTTPGGGYGFRFFDPDGRVVEVSSDVAPRPYRTLEERESIPVKLSHVVVNSANLEPVKAFYEAKLGFRMSDWLGNYMTFLRCSTDHHSLAIARAPHAALNHISFEMRGIDEFMRGTGRLLRRGYHLLWGPGRHGAGDNTFSYFLDPNGNVGEYTTAMEQIMDDAAWQPRVWDPSSPDTQDQWGTSRRQEPPENVPAESRNIPDAGAWTAPPV